MVKTLVSWFARFRWLLVFVGARVSLNVLKRSGRHGIGPSGFDHPANIAGRGKLAVRVPALQIVIKFRCASSQLFLFEIVPFDLVTASANPCRVEPLHRDPSAVAKVNLILHVRFQNQRAGGYARGLAQPHRHCSAHTRRREDSFEHCRENQCLRAYLEPVEDEQIS